MFEVLPQGAGGTWSGKVRHAVVARRGISQRDLMDRCGEDPPPPSNMPASFIFSNQ